MDHFGRGDDARRLARTAFVLAAGAILVHALVWAAAAATSAHAFGWIEPGQTTWHLGFAGALMGAFVLAAALLLWVRVRSLRGGGPAEARRFGARRLDRGGLDIEIEDLVAAAGVASPELWILDEPAINAFTVGVDPTDAVVILTRGCLDELPPRDQRALLAHELARIADGDMLLNTRIACAIESLTLIAVLARACRFAAGRGPGSVRVPARLAALSLTVLGAPGYLLARAVQVVLTRRRGCTADTTAVVLAADPHGLVSLLERTADDGKTSRADVSRARVIEYQHALFAPCPGLALGRRRRWRLHAPAELRVRRIGFVHGELERELTYAQTRLRQIATPAETLADQLDELAPSHVRRARRVLDSIPEPVRQALRSPIGCHAVACGLLTCGRTPRQEAQHGRWVERGHPAAVLAAREVHEHLDALDPAAWITLVDLAQPALRAMTPQQRAALALDLRLLANGDADALGFFTVQVWLHGLRGAAAAKRVLATRIRARRGALPHVRVLLLAIAHLGNDDESAARSAFADAMHSIGAAPGRPDLDARDDAVLGAVGRALRVLETLTPAAKHQIVRACLSAIGGDGAVTPVQAEVVRAVAKAFGCAVPPTLDPEHAEDAGADRVMSRIWTDELAALLS